MSFSNFFARTKVRAVEAAPTIGVGLGVAGIAGTAVLASRSTLRVGEVLEKHDETIQNLDKLYGFHKLSIEDPERFEIECPNEEVREYCINLDKDQYARLHFGAWVNTSARFVKLYAPAIAMGVASAALIVASHRTMNNRLNAATAAYTVLHQTFEAYRKKARETFGENEVAEMEAKNFFGAPDQDGRLNNENLPMVEKQSAYRVFDDRNPRFVSDDMTNRQFLSTQQNYFNDLLTSRGYVFLNDVYAALGFQTTPEGQLLGWVKDKPEHWASHNGYVDFGIFDTEDLTERLATDTLSGDIRLRFNIDGMIYREI